MPEADLVLEGGGVKGIGLLGAVTAMVKRNDPYTFERYAGTSAGSIVASFLAAGLSVDRLKDIMLAEDFSTFEDESALFKHFKKLGEGIGLLFHEGLFVGDTLHTFIAETLAEGGVHTWQDLARPDPLLPPEQQYKLVVVISDVSRGRELRLPWDYKTQLGLDPDTQLVADAVRASASIPFFFRPLHLRADRGSTAGKGYVLCTDGGMLSNYPIDIFDRVNNPRWPTLGVKLSAREQINHAHWSPNANAIDLARSLISTMMNAHDALHIDDPYYADRTVFVDTTGFSGTNFQLSSNDKNTLFDNGMTAAQNFLTKWDWATWQAANPARAPRPEFKSQP